MSDTTEMMDEGVLCERCGEYISEPVGYPQLCCACELEDKK